MYKKYIKRFLDVVISFFLIILSLPIMIIEWIIIKSIFRSSVIYKQERIGYLEKPYTIYKFKTMTDDTKEVTKVTEKLRNMGIDELPQLFNVLKGDMSLIGPRPFIVGDKLPIMYEKLRHSVRPGISGLAQISGGRFISHKKKLEYDAFYANNVSFLLDVKIFFKTIIYMIKQIFK